MQKYYPKKRTLNKLKASLLLLMLVCFAGVATAQIPEVFMRDGSYTIDRSAPTIHFYDSHGGARAHNYWERWYNHGEEFTFTIKPQTSGDKIKVTFDLFTAYGDPTDPDSPEYAQMQADPNNYDGISIGQWSLRLNDDILRVYDGEAVANDKLIAEYTGNTQTAFTVMSDGAITFYFKSNTSFREEGWYATVQLQQGGIVAPQAPFIRRSTCEDEIEILATTLNPDHIYYTIDGTVPQPSGPNPSDPLNTTLEYLGTPIEWLATQTTLKVRAITVFEGEELVSSSMTEVEFGADDRVPVPGKPTISVSGNVVTMTPAVRPAGLNDTYQVRYTMTTDGTDPGIPTQYSTLYTGPITCSVAGTKFRAKTVALSCTNQISDEYDEAELEQIYAPKPVISFDNMTITAIEGGITYDILYTLDGSTPAVDPETGAVTGTFSNTQVSLSGLNPGQTVRALAYRANNNTEHTANLDYHASEVVSVVYVPEGGSGVYNNSTVLLDDREDHSWSYYSDGDQPIHSLKPADVKITYTGYGANTMTSTSTANMPANSAFDTEVTSSQVAVNVGEAGNQFIYLKTLENDNPEGGEGANTYSYTMIPNPFQVRPTYGNSGPAPTTRTIYFSYGRSNSSEAGTLQITYNGNQPQTININGSGNFSIIANVGSTVSYTLSETNSGGNNRYIWFRAQYDDSSGSDFIEQQNCYRTNRPVSGTSSAIAPSVNIDFRGFYAWRVKSLGGGLTITGKSVGDIIYPDEHIKFVTNNAEGNEVEFEALWAKAYVSTSALSSYATNNGSYQNAYERNFLIGSTTILNVGYPCTYSSFYPNGTTDGTTPATTNNQGVPNGRVTAATRTATDDSKVENYVLNGGTLNTGGYKVTIGRGATSSSNPSITPLSGTYTSATNAILRIESGSYGGTTNLYGTPSVGSNLVHLDLIFGSDYDRAKNDNSKLSISNSATIQHGSHTATGSSWISFQHLDIVVKSGSIQQGYWNSDNGDYAHSFYCRSTLSQGGQYPGITYLTVEGGEFASINGGRGNYAEGTADPDDVVFSLRMKGGTVHGAIYGAASANPSWGGRRIVITKGMVEGWIAAGCNGTSGGGATIGESYIYIGGNAQVGNSANPRTLNETVGGNVFGAGRGGEGHGTDANPASMRNSYIVVADNGSVLHNVYGGGEYGYTGCSSGNGGTDPNTSSNIYILGGTVQENVFGGGNMTKGTNTNITMKGGTVVGNFYGGSNDTGTIENVATINVSGGTVNNVFGGGYGTGTNMADNTVVNVSGGTINNNVYGGGALGTVAGNTTVTVSGGTMNDVYGAGKGATNQTANVAGNTTVRISNGVVNGEVYGGGEAGNVNQAGASDITSTVAISGGEVKKDVFGGGKNGTTQGDAIVNISGGILRMNVFGGAFGAHGSVYFAGLKTVNILGGRIYGSVYGGSRNANDALSLNPGTYSQTQNGVETIVADDDDPCSITNVCGGQIEQHVYAAGYYGVTYGSVYAFIGLNAINDAPNTQPTSGLDYVKRSLVINGNVWAGGDWGTFSGSFGAPTVSGNSNVYVDGSGYSTNGNDASVDNYMNIKGSIYGCGTSCDAGNKARILILRNYGADVANTGVDSPVNPVANATRQFTSIQRFHNAYFDNAHVGFIGQGKINSLNNTEKYSIYEVDENIYFANGSTFVMNAPSSQIKSFHSVSCGNVYAATPSFTVIDYDDLGHLGNTDNKIRVNGGSYIEIKYVPENPGEHEKVYGQLEGFCHMMTSNDNAEETCAYARPKQSNETGNKISDAEDNPDDGGFRAYRGSDNIYTADGTRVDAGDQVQLRYENHTPELTKANSEYYRIWRYGGMDQVVEAVLNAEASGTSAYKTVEVTVQLPSWNNVDGGYFKFASTGTSSLNTLIDYGSQVLTYNAANFKDALTGENTWMYYNGTANATATLPTTPYPNTNPLTPGLNDIEDNPNLNFGLVLIPGQAMTGSNYIICSEADNYLAGLAKPFTCSDITHVPTITLRLTYRDDLNANASLDPMYIPLIQYDKDNNVINNVTIKVEINTSTIITSGLRAKVYARMIGASEPKAVAKTSVVLPTFEVYQSGEEAHFTLKKVEFKQGAEGIALGTGSNPQVQYTEIAANDLNIDRFALSITAAPNPDNTDDWRFDTGEQDGVAHPSTMPNYQTNHLIWGGSNDRGIELGQAGGRSALTLDFNLYYNSNVLVNDQTQMGEVVFTLEFDNYKYGSGEQHTQTFTVTLEVYRIGKGKNFYVAGTGLDKQGRGTYPDTPAKTVNYIFNRCGFLPGDNIFIVNNLPINTGTIWDGSGFQNEVNIYRYPGGHGLSGTTQGFDNSPYLGALVTVNKELTMRGVTMDGMYAEAMAAVHNTIIYPAECEFDGKANKPLIEVLDGGRLNLTSGTVMQNNYSAANGGAVSVDYGGVLAMNQNAEISNNYSEQLGAGVYMDGAMIVSDYVKVFDNKKGSDQSNIWLTEAEEEEGSDARFKVVQIGTSANDAYGELKNDETGAALVGVDKDDWGHSVDGFMPVVYAETGTEDYLELPYNEPQTIIVHDRDIYTLRKYLSPNYLYWIFTWVEAVTSEPNGFEANNIDTPEELAWAISIVNGENNVVGTEAHKPNQAFVITKDINMSQYIWVPIGSESYNYGGQFEGNGHVVSGLRTSISEKNIGMFGTTKNATIQNLIVNAAFSPAADNIGTVIGEMDGGTLSNVEGAGSLENRNDQGVVGGLVGTTTSTATIHSAFAVPTMKGGKNMGGLVGINAGKLYNSYANPTVTPATNTGGLVAVNEQGGEIENCYAVVGDNTYPAFANTNNGKINICYADKANGYVVNSGTGEGVVLAGHGTYGAVKGRKEIGYMYGDNAVSATNDYVASAITYGNGHNITKWPGLLSTLNQWVAGHSGYTPWFRPTSGDINGDLPVLGFTKDNSLATEDSKFLYYGSNVDANGLDNLFTVYNGKTANMFLYGNATDVTLGNGSNPLFINEDAVLLQKATDGNTPDITATVGVTFDNSCGDGLATNTGAPLTYDWHFMSTPLQNAPINATYGATTGFMNPANIESMDANCYFPNGLFDQSSVTWDFYTYSEEFHHWVNLKRTDHFYQENGQSFTYDNETSFEPGKGYMMAISQDSYMNSTGLLNNDDVPVTITNKESQHLDTEYNEGWNLVGNPYQGYLDLMALFDADVNPNASQAYVYDADLKAFTPFVNGASENPTIIERYLHQHQAFFVHSEAENVTLTFKPGMATATMLEGYTAPYFRGEGRINYPLVNLFVENIKGNRDLAVIEFNRPELGGATKVNGVRNANFQVAASLEGHRYGLVFTPEGTEKVPVHFTTEENGTFTLTWETLHGDFTSLLLVDNMTGTITDMLRADHYTFDATTDDYASRFYITYAVTGVDEYNEGDGTFAFFDGSEWVVNGKGQLDVVDVQGRTLYSERLVNDKNRVSLNGVAAGVYLLRVSDGTNTMVQKIVVK